MCAYPVRNLGDLLDRAVAEHATREAVVFGEERLNFLELQAKTNQLAKALLHYGVQVGDKVAICMTNRPEWLYSEFAVAKLGGVIVPMYTRLGLVDVEYILKQSDCSVLIMMDRFMKHSYIDMLYEICPEIRTSSSSKELRVAKLPCLRRVICLSPERKQYHGTIDFSEALKIGRESVSDQELADRQASVDPELVVNIPFTAGTTGLPKGVMTTHAQYLQGVQGMGENWRVTSSDRFFGNNPLCFNLGNMSSALMPVMYGACVVLMELFEPGEALRVIQKERCTILSGFATVYIMLLDHLDLNENRYDTSTLRTGLIGLPNVSNPERLLKMVQEKLHLPEITAAYGMTENTGCTSMTRIGDSLEIIAHTVGKPLPGVAVKVVDPLTGEDLPTGKEGELCTKGYLVMKGYFKMPEETAKKITAEGWFRTGDLAAIDANGYIQIKGRMVDMIKSGGISIYPGEIELFLSQYPNVKDVQVVGIPDNRRGEVSVAFIQPNPEVTLTTEEIIAFCRGKIADYKIPRHVFFVIEYPLSSIGKIQKFKLRSMATQALSTQ